MKQVTAVIRPRGNRYRLDTNLNGKRFRKTLKSITPDMIKAEVINILGHSNIIFKFSGINPSSNKNADNDMLYIEAVDKYMAYKYEKLNAWKKGYPGGINPNGKCVLSTLRRLYEYVNPTYVSDITVDNITEYLISEKNRGDKVLSERTMNKYKTRLKTFFQYCVDVDLIIKSPARMLKNNKYIAPVKRGFTLEEVDTIINNCNKKYRPLFTLLARTGIRSCDAWLLTKDNFVENNTQLQFNSQKNNEVYHIPIGKEVQEIVNNCKTEYLFPFLVGKKSPSDEPRKELKRAFGEYGVGAKYMKKHGLNFHSFRHGLAERLLQSGAGKDRIQKLLGHKHITTTAIYAKGLSVESLRDLVD